MTHRLHYIDNLKGVLILLVVLGHCIQCTDLDFDHNAVFRYIYSFHMPLFMCVSGFVSYKPDIKWQTVQKRFRQLIIPFLAWVAVSCCVHLDPTLFLAKVVHPDSGLWFLWTLFFIVLLMWLCNWIVTCLKVKIEYVVCFFSLLMMGIMVALKFKLFGFQFIPGIFRSMPLDFSEGNINTFGRNGGALILCGSPPCSCVWHTGGCGKTLLCSCPQAAMWCTTMCTNLWSQEWR